MAQTIATTSRPAYQAYQILYIGFIVAPLLAGLDKFTHFLTNWDQYLAPAVERLLPIGRRELLVHGWPVVSHDWSPREVGARRHAH